MNTLFLRLEGPLQSWGTRARWGERDTALEPTKSGVVGLLACALGWGRGHDREIRELGQALAFGVRIDLPGQVVRDYHTVVGGVMAAEGKVKITQSSREPETVVAPRFYLADASFLAAVHGPAERIAQLAAALARPVWPVYLGRKSCPPAVDPLAGTGAYASLAEALAAWPRSDRAPDGALRAVVEVGPGAGQRQTDQIDRLSLRRYLPRFAQEILVDPPRTAPDGKENDLCTSPA